MSASSPFTTCDLVLTADQVNGLSRALSGRKETTGAEGKTLPQASLWKIFTYFLKPSGRVLQERCGILLHILKKDPVLVEQNRALERKSNLKPDIHTARRHAEDPAENPNPKKTMARSTLAWAAAAIHSISGVLMHCFNASIR